MAGGTPAIRMAGKISASSVEPMPAFPEGLESEFGIDFTPLPKYDLSTVKGYGTKELLMAGSIFKALQLWWLDSKIKSLEAAFQRQPTPAAVLQLAEAHKVAGNMHRAAQILKLGAARFPRATEIVNRHHEAERIERENEKKRLIEKIQNQPNPILYTRLAELFKIGGELDKTIETCQKGIRAFPKYGGAYLVLGQIYAEKKQWGEAAAKLEKSVELDKYNYLALKMLAQVYAEQGRLADAVKRLEDILYFAPGDEAALELLKKAKAKLALPAAKTMVEMPEVKAQAEPTAQKKNGEKETVLLPRDRQFAKGLAALRNIQDVTGAILLDQYGMVMASGLDAGLDEGLAAALVTNVYRAASGNAVKLGAGQFEEGLIEGERGNVHILLSAEMILAVFAKPDVKLGLLEKGIREFVRSIKDFRL
jgi:predicted regulator of Ras-like GTPase activity (Roadblock/LC7/MglB family)